MEESLKKEMKAILGSREITSLIDINCCNYWGKGHLDRSFE